MNAIILVSTSHYLVMMLQRRGDVRLISQYQHFLSFNPQVMYDDTYFPRIVNSVACAACFVYRNDLFLLRFMFIKAVIVNLYGNIENCLKSNSSETAVMLVRFVRHSEIFNRECNIWIFFSHQRGIIWPFVGCTCTLLA